jgi:hypothetical protein
MLTKKRVSLTPGRYFCGYIDVPQPPTGTGTLHLALFSSVFIMMMRVQNISLQRRRHFNLNQIRRTRESRPILNYYFGDLIFIFRLYLRTDGNISGCIHVLIPCTWVMKLDISQLDRLGSQSLRPLIASSNWWIDQAHIVHFNLALTISMGTWYIHIPADSRTVPK